MISFIQGAKVLIAKSDRVLMLDSKTEREVWRREWDWPHLACAPKDHDTFFYERKTILTDSLCGFVYPYVPKDLDDEPTVDCGLIMMRLFDARTGKEVLCADCWQFPWSKGMLPAKMAPCAVGCGNVVCAASIVAHHKHSTEINVKNGYFEEENSNAR